MKKKRALFIVGLGALGGFAYYYFIGCNSGYCPITSSPVISTVYGGVLGLIIASGATDGKKKAESKQEPTQDSDDG